jgi:hypothetical protein
MTSGSGRVLDDSTQVEVGKTIQHRRADTTNYSIFATSA